MNDFEKLEKELSSLSPRPPTDEFTKQIEDALGEAGSVAMCHLHDPGGTIDRKVLFYQNLSLDNTGYRNCRCGRVFLLFLTTKLE